MPIPNVERGDLIRTTSFVTNYYNTGETKPALSVTYSAGRGNEFLCVLLGKTTKGREISVDDLLHTMGWVFDPDKADKILKEKGF